MDEIVAVTVTADSRDWLEGFVRRLVEDRVVACGNVVPGVRSIYRWEGEVQEADEALAILHTRASRVDDVRTLVLSDHPYDVAQVLVLPATSATDAYRDWVLASTR